jgi:hypothetical protein
MVLVDIVEVPVPVVEPIMQITSVIVFVTVMVEMLLALVGAV